MRVILQSSFLTQRISLWIYKMNNREKFLSSLSGEERESMAKVFDKAEAARRSGRAAFTHFLSEREYSLFKDRQKNIDSVPYRAFGGFLDAGRVIICFSDYEEEFPIQVIKLWGKGAENLKHPDLLGSIMSLGIERKNVGDIVKGEEDWFIFAHSDMAGFISDSLKEVGGVYVTCSVSEPEEVEVRYQYEEIVGTVASLRADSVVSVMLKTSRSKAAEYIEGQRFFLNQVLCTKCDKEIKENDILTVRHHGKAKLGEISGTSKKGRIFITIQKYM